MNGLFFKLSATNFRSSKLTAMIFHLLINRGGLFNLEDQSRRQSMKHCSRVLLVKLKKLN